MPEIRAVAFDLDGLIFDTEALSFRVVAAMLAERGKVPTPELIASMIGRRAVDSGDSFRRLAGLEESSEALMADLKARFMAELDTAVHPTAGLFALLDRLETLGLPRAVATSSRKAYAEGLLSRHGLLHRFAFVLAAEDVSHGKPDPEVYLLAASRFGVPPDRMLVLEDSAAGVAAAKAAGAFAVGVPHDHSPAAGLTAADLIVPRLDDPLLLSLLSADGEKGQPR